VHEQNLYWLWSQHTDVYVQRSVAGCFAVLRQLRSIRRSIPPSLYQSLVVALVILWLDYHNATLTGLPACLLNRLQSVLNAAARSIAGLRRSEHITDALDSFHWLGAPEPSSNCLSRSSRHCTAVLVGPAAARRWSADKTSRPAALVDLQSSRRPSVAACHCRRSLLLLLAHDFGTVYWPTSSLPHRSQHFIRNWKHLFWQWIIPRHCSVVEMVSHSILTDTSQAEICLKSWAHRRQDSQRKTEETSDV